MTKAEALSLAVTALGSQAVHFSDLEKKYRNGFDGDTAKRYEEAMHIINLMETPND